MGEHRQMGQVPTVNNPQYRVFIIDPATKKPISNLNTQAIAGDFINHVERESSQRDDGQVDMNELKRLRAEYASADLAMMNDTPQDVLRRNQDPQYVMMQKRAGEVNTVFRNFTAIDTDGNQRISKAELAANLNQHINTTA
jgi:hypothetical protein